MGKIVLSGEFVVPEEILEAVKAALPEHVEDALRGSGVLKCEITEKEGEPGVFKVYEEFVSRPRFYEHQENLSKTEWAEITKTCRRNYRIEEV